jgi:hypothetical protein
MTPATLGFVKKLAAKEQYIPDPPTILSLRAKGVSMVSNAIEPTMTKLMDRRPFAP